MKAVNLALKTQTSHDAYVFDQKNKGKNKLSSTMLLIKRHAKQRKAIYPTSILRDDKVGHAKNFEIQTTSEDIVRRTTQDIVGTLDTCKHFFLNKYVDYNPIQPVVPERKGLWKETRKKNRVSNFSENTFRERCRTGPPR